MEFLEIFPACHFQKNKNLPIPPSDFNKISDQRSYFGLWSGKLVLILKYQWSRTWLTCPGMAAKDNPKNKKIMQKHGFMRIKQRLIYQKFLLPSKGYIQMVGHRVTGNEMPNWPTKKCHSRFETEIYIDGNLITIPHHLGWLKQQVKIGINYQP